MGNGSITCLNKTSRQTAASRKEINKANALIRPIDRWRCTHNTTHSHHLAITQGVIMNTTLSLFAHQFAPTKASPSCLRPLLAILTPEALEAWKPHGRVSPKLTSQKFSLRMLQTRGNSATHTAPSICRYYTILAERKCILFQVIKKSPVNKSALICTNQSVKMSVDLWTLLT